MPEEITLCDVVDKSEGGEGGKDVQARKRLYGIASRMAEYFQFWEIKDGMHVYLLDFECDPRSVLKLFKDTLIAYCGRGDRYSPAEELVIMEAVMKVNDDPSSGIDISGLYRDVDRKWVNKYLDMLERT
ncbi:MAG: hypothetical protein AABW49_02605 [Nanoarchaeota archaeon]